MKKKYHMPLCTHTYNLCQHLCATTGQQTPPDPKIHDEISTEPLYGRSFSTWVEHE